MQYGGQQRPVQHHVRQTCGHLQGRQAQQPLALCLQRRLAAHGDGKGQRRDHHDIGRQAVDVVDGRQRRKADVTAIRQQAQGAPDFKALGKVHVRPEAAIAVRDVEQASTA